MSEREKKSGGEVIDHHNQVCTVFLSLMMSAVTDSHVLFAFLQQVAGPDRGPIRSLAPPDALFANSSISVEELCCFYSSFQLRITISHTFSLTSIASSIQLLHFLSLPFLQN